MSTFDDFQKTEYEHVAEAHFKANEAISLFFRHYLLVMSLPLPMLGVLFSLLGRNDNFERVAISLLGVASPFFIGVGIVGACMVAYIINLKMDVVLYARVVNSIRKYFYDGLESSHPNKLLMRQLPQSAYVPAYHDRPFAAVVLAFATFNTLYVAFGFHLLILTQVNGITSLNDLGMSTYTRAEMLGIPAGAAVLFCAHFLLYLRLARYREFSYLRGNAIGIDIDGVLNKHREKFCEMAAAKLGATIRPEDIKVLPVHENAHLADQITRADERRIFNDPDYWTSMPALEGAADSIRSIRHGLLLSVHVFTHRPWPDARPNEIDGELLRRSWRSAAQAIALQAKTKLLSRLWVYLVIELNHRTSIRYITKYWLRSSGIEFDSLLVERGNENIMYARSRYENRFNYARRKRIRFFVEDDWIKAIKLSYVCDVVFLMDHPYNQTATDQPSKHADVSIIGSLPANVVRVRSWLELKKILAQLV
jgi:uncharacterized HAD superfamily protein